MAIFTYTPDYGAQFEVKPRVSVTKFDDGYEQRQATGLNTQAKNWSLRFSLRTDAEADEIEAFLVARNGVESFQWSDINNYRTAAGPTLSLDFTTGTYQVYDPAYKSYVCRSWTRTKEKFNLNTIECRFEQVFE